MRSADRSANAATAATATHQHYEPTKARTDWNTNAATAATATHQHYGPTKARTDWNTNRAERMNACERLASSMAAKE